MEMGIVRRRATFTPSRESTLKTAARGEVYIVALDQTTRDRTTREWGSREALFPTTRSFLSSSNLLHEAQLSHNIIDVAGRIRTFRNIKQILQDSDELSRDNSTQRRDGSILHEERCLSCECGRKDQAPQETC